MIRLDCLLRSSANELTDVHFSTQSRLHLLFGVQLLPFLRPLFPEAVLPAESDKRAAGQTKRRDLCRTRRVHHLRDGSAVHILRTWRTTNQHDRPVHDDRRLRSGSRSALLLCHRQRRQIDVHQLLFVRQSRFGRIQIHATGTYAEKLTRLEM